MSTFLFNAFFFLTLEVLMNKLFSLRLDRVTNYKLAYLARESHRSRASVIRWLIRFATIGHDVLSPYVADPDAILSNPSEKKIESLDLDTNN